MTRPRGFTLIEAIAVIAITGIIASVVAVFVARPVQGYVDSVRRALLADAADTALRRIARDIRTAVPNSVRLTGTTQLEFVPTRDGGRYRVEQTGGVGNVLDFTTTDGDFDVFGASALDAVAGDYLVVFNTGQTSTSGCNGADVYEGCNRRTIIGSTLSGGVTTGLSFTATASPLPFDSPGHRFQVVPSSGPVTYVCEGTLGVNAAGNGNAALRRYAGYATGGGTWSAATPDGTGTLLADNVSDCAFTYATVTARDGLVTLKLTLTRANESVALYHEVHVDNQP